MFIVAISLAASALPSTMFAPMGQWCFATLLGFIVAVFLVVVSLLLFVVVAFGRIFLLLAMFFVRIFLFLVVLFVGIFVFLAIVLFSAGSMPCSLLASPCFVLCCFDIACGQCSRRLARHAKVYWLKAANVWCQAWAPTSMSGQNDSLSIVSRAQFIATFGGISSAPGRILDLSDFL